MSTTGTSFYLQFCTEATTVFRSFYFFDVLKSLSSAVRGWMADTVQVRSSGCTQPSSVGSQSSRPGVNWKRVWCAEILLLKQFVSVGYVIDDALLERSVPVSIT